METKKLGTLVVFEKLDKLNVLVDWKLLKLYLESGYDESTLEADLMVMLRNDESSKLYRQAYDIDLRGLCSLSGTLENLHEYQIELDKILEYLKTRIEYFKTLTPDVCLRLIELNIQRPHTLGFIFYKYNNGKS